MILRVGRIALGVTCLVMGVIGLFLPFLQGILFLAIGLGLLSTESDRARRWREWLQGRFKLPSKDPGERNDGTE